MANKRRFAYRRRKQQTKHVQRDNSSIFLCGTCSFQGIDAYDIAAHLRNNNYCGVTSGTSTNLTNAPPAASAAAASAAASSSSIQVGDDSSTSSRPEEGDSFMYHDYHKDDHSSSPGSCSSSSLTNRSFTSSKELFSRHDDEDDDGDATSRSSSTSNNTNLRVNREGEQEDDSSVASAISSHGVYEIYSETTFRTGVDDVVHVGLAELCRKIKAPAFAYN
jgi:hypothetical protein